jgi:hypothetical protein
VAGVASTAKLLASLDLKDNMSKGLAAASANIGKLEGRFAKIGGIAQRGVSNAIGNITRLAVVGAGALVGAIGLGVRSLADLARTTQQTEAVIASTGSKAGVSAIQVRSLAESLENLSTVDDKVIQDGENMLLTFTGIGKEVFPRATKAALNMAVAMAAGNVEAVDLKASSIQLGKALNDPVKGITALRKVGVAFTADQQKQIKALVKSGKIVEAQTIILKELETEFGNAAKAAGKGPEASWRRLQDVGEDLTQALARGVLPALVRVSDFLSAKLADPKVIKRLDAIGVSFGQAVDKALAFVGTVDFDSIADSLGTAVGFAGQIVSAFLAMPDWVKTAVITGWGLNKLTGGAFGSLIGELGKGLIKGVLGMNAGVVNINAAAVNGGIPGVAAKGGLGLASKVFLIGEAIGLGLLVNEVRQGQSDQNSAFARSLAQQQAAFLAQKPDQAAVRNALAGVEQGIHDLESNPLNVLVQGDALDQLRKMRADLKSQLSGQGTTVGNFGRTKADARPRTVAELTAIEQRAIAAGMRPTADQIQRTFERNSAREVAATDRIKASVDRLPEAIRRAIRGMQINVGRGPLERDQGTTGSKPKSTTPQNSPNPDRPLIIKNYISGRDVSDVQITSGRGAPTAAQVGAR